MSITRTTGRARWVTRPSSTPRGLSRSSEGHQDGEADPPRRIHHPQDRLKDTHFLGANLDLFESEKTLFQFTIGLSVVFMAIAVVTSVYVNRQ